MRFHTEVALRQFALEYTRRWRRKWNMPASWNAFGHFMDLAPSALGSRAFRPYPFKDHLFDLMDFVDYVSSSRVSATPSAVKEASPSIIYSYQLIPSRETHEIATAEGSQVLIQALWFRKQHSNLFVGGICGLAKDARFMRQKQRMSDIRVTSNVPGASGDMGKPLSIEEEPLYHRHYYSLEYDLRSGTVGRQYVFADYEKSLDVLTNDPLIGTPLDIYPTIQERLHKHDEVFSLLSAAAYLCDYYAFRFDLVREEPVHRAAVSAQVRSGRIKAVADTSPRIVYKLVPAIRVVDVGRTTDQERHARTFTPPEFRVEVTGHWRALASPSAVGKDQYGEPVLGMTWIEAHERWRSRPVRPLIVFVRQPLSTAPESVRRENSQE